MTWNRIRKWYSGRYVTSGSVVPGSSADSPATYHGEPYYERTPSAELLRGLVQCWRRRWPVLIGIAIGVVGLILTVFK